jgi:hypothetical protein
MDRRPADRILDEWDAVARHAARPAEAPQRRRTSWAGGSLVGLAPLVAVALVVAVGIAWLGGRESGPAGQGSPAPSGPVVAVSSAPSEPASTPSATAPAQTASPTAPILTASPPPADPCKLEAAITSWEGAAGSRIANLTATNVGQLGCVIPALTPAQLIDAGGRVLAETGAARGGSTMTVHAGETVTTQASVANVCGAPPTPPVTIRFDFGTAGIVTARPASPTDDTVPPCNGPSQPSDMSIHEWSR